MAGCRDVPARALAPSVPAALEPAPGRPSTATPELYERYSGAKLDVTQHWQQRSHPHSWPRLRDRLLNQQRRHLRCQKADDANNRQVHQSRPCREPAWRSGHSHNLHLAAAGGATSNKRYPVVYVYGYNGRVTYGDSPRVPLFDKALADAVQDMIMSLDANTRLAVGTWTARPRAATRPTSRRLVDYIDTLRNASAVREPNHRPLDGRRRRSPPCIGAPGRLWRGCCSFGRL